MLDTCVYVHKKPNGDIFYVGIGNSKRPYYKFRKNKHWSSVVKKYPNYIIEILHENIDWKEACEIEIDLISKYKRKIDGGILCNITLGGDGSKGLKHSEKTKEILRNLSTGNKNCVGYKHTEETKRNMSLAHIGHKIKEETKLKMSIVGKGRKGRESDKLNASKAHEKNRGRLHSEEEKLKRKLTLRKSLGKKIEVDGKIYSTIVECCEELKMNRGKISSRLRNPNFKNYKYV